MKEPPKCRLMAAEVTLDREHVHQDDGQIPSVTEVLTDMLEMACRVPSAVARQAPGGQLLCEVLDTHHPHLPGRVGVAWHNPDGTRLERWVSIVSGLHLCRGDQVLMLKPANTSSWVITQKLTSAIAADNQRDTPSDANARTLRLERGEVVRVATADGEMLLEVASEREGPVVRLVQPQIDLEVAGRFRVRAETIELEASEGGVDVRTSGEVVMRGRPIRLN